MKMDSSSEDDEKYIEEDSLSVSSVSRYDINSSIENEDEVKDKNITEFKTKQNVKNGCETAVSTNSYSRSSSKESEDYINECNEVDVKLLVGQDFINLHLNVEMKVQGVIDIVGDMFGLIENRLGLEIDGELVNPNLKLKSWKERKNLEMKVVFCIDDEVTSVIVGNNDSSEFVNRNIKEFQSASVQTNARKHVYNRETQTPHFPLIDKATNTRHAKSVQADSSVRPEDKIMYAKEYIPYDELVNFHNKQAVMIQKFVRRFLAQKRIVKMKKERDIALTKKKLQMEGMPYEKLQNNIQEIMNKRPTLLHDDFAKAYALLTDWLKREKNEIRKETCGKNQKVALHKLFSKEMECLHYIQKCRMMKKIENDHKLKLKILNEASQSTSKLYSRSCNSLIDCENTLRASTFKNLYSDLRRHDLKENKRIMFLNNLKEFLKSLKAPECTQEMLMLIDREIQMIHLGIKKSSLEGSRRRLEELFLYLSTDPEFNPGSINFQEKLKKVTLFQCRTCKELKPPEKFSIDLIKGLNHCTTCILRKELAHSNIILAPYKQMVQQIYSEEIKNGSNEGYVNLLQPTGLYYLVQRIWQGRSCLSEESDLDLLRFIRWNKNYPWSPWNCILLTDNEAELHQAVDDIKNFYGEHFIKRIENKHLQAKIKFTDLEDLNDRIKMTDHSSLQTSSKLTHESFSAIINPKNKKPQQNYNFMEPVPLCMVRENEGSDNLRL